MKKLRWTRDGGFWDLDVSTPRTLEGAARPVPGELLPLGLSRGTKLTRPKQIDFMQRFMFAPFVPSYSGGPDGHGFSLQRVLTFPFHHNWFVTLLGQFNVQKFVSSVKKSREMQHSESSWLKMFGRQLCDKSLYAVNFCSEFFTPDDTLLLSFDSYGDEKTPRKKAVIHHRFPGHSLTAEASWPGLFVDKDGSYWDVPLSMAIDVASVSSDSGASYHFCIQNNASLPELYATDQSNGVPASLLPGLSVKSAFSFKKNIDIWRSKAQKLPMVQPYDLFLSNPHVSASWTIGAVSAASLGDNFAKPELVDDSQGFRGFRLSVPRVKSSLFADMFASASFTAQHGNFQRLFLDLTRFHARLDFSSGSKFIPGAVQLVQDLLNSHQPSPQVFQTICPSATFSFQQQIAGPFSFRVDSGIVVDLKNQHWHVRATEPVFAIEHALQVLGSAKAVAWYSPKQQEFMVELRFFET